MRTIKVLAIVAAMLAAVPAFGQGAAGAPAPPATKPAAPPKMEAPKPPKEIEDMAKGMKGTWKCDGKVGEEGQQMPVKTTVQWGVELDGFWIVGKYAAVKDKAMPFTYKAAAYISFDAAAKQFVRTDFDNMGGWVQMTSKPGDPGKMVWTGEGSMMGQKVAQNETMTRKSDKEVELAGQAGTFKWTFNCKK